MRHKLRLLPMLHSVCMSMLRPHFSTVIDLPMPTPEHARYLSQSGFRSYILELCKDYIILQSVLLLVGDTGSHVHQLPNCCCPERLGTQSNMTYSQFP